MTRDIISRALTLWGLHEATTTLVAQRENAVYKVTAGSQSYALRLHRKGYRNDAELGAELAWLAQVARGGLRVPAPIPAQDGAMMHIIDGVQIDMLGWLSGETLTAGLQKLTATERLAAFHALGQQMAQLHLACDAWTPPTGFTRCAWDHSGLVADDPLWGKFWENPALSSEDRRLFDALRQRAGDDLKALAGADFGLIHADLVPDNVMIDGACVQLIDFDDGGFGFRAFDIATALFKHRHRPDYIQLRTALIEGYHSLRGLDLGALDLFMVLRATTYVGWIITRMDAVGAHERQTRFTAQARQLAQAYLRS